MQADFDPAPDRPDAKSITLALPLAVRTLVDEGLTTLEMLERLLDTHPNVNWTLDGIERLARQVSDRRPVARRYLESQSLAMAKNVVDHGKPAVHVRALEGLGVLAPEDAGTSGITIHIGGDAKVALLIQAKPAS
ncbi:MAG TPA: hypothetical protein VGJ80_06285 [Gemmatimonadales bacterium]|jgi:hypothetical protein